MDDCSAEELVVVVVDCRPKTTVGVSKPPVSDDCCVGAKITGLECERRELAKVREEVSEEEEEEVVVIVVVSVPSADAD